MALLRFGWVTTRFSACIRSSFHSMGCSITQVANSPIDTLGRQRRQQKKEKRCQEDRTYPQHNRQSDEGLFFGKQFGESRSLTEALWQTEAVSRINSTIQRAFESL